MLRTMRANAKWIFYILAIAFVLWLAIGQVMSVLGSSPNVVLRVNGDEFQVNEFQQRVQAAYQQIRIGQGAAAERVVAEVESKVALLELWCEGLARLMALGTSSIAPALETPSFRAANLEAHIRTSERNGKRNGMISDSAVRASIVPAIPRVWRSEIEDLRTDLRGWLQFIAVQDDDWIPIHFEFGFGLPPSRER